MKNYLIFLVILLIFSVNANDCNGERNNLPLIKDPPKFIRSVPNGKLYHFINGDEIIRLVILSGDAKSQGLAEGQLLKEEILTNIKGLQEGLRIKVHDLIMKYVPALSFLIDGISKIAWPAVNFGLSLTWIFTRDNIPERYVQEVKGMSEAIGVPYMDLLKASLFPELIKAACSLVGVWGDAVSNDGPYFLRAFDWDENNPITRYPVITVYHSIEPGSIPYVSFGYAGLVGTFTAFNEEGFGVAEKYWYLHPDDPVERSVVGKPWTFVLRDIAQFAKTFDKAIDMLKKTPRTCSIHIGLVSGIDNEYRGIWYSKDHLDIYDDKHWPQNDTKHWYISGTNYIDKGTQPSHNDCIGSLLQAEHGKILPEYLYRVVAPMHKTGNCQLLVMDMEKYELFFAYGTYKGKRAYEKPMFFIDMVTLFTL